MTQFTFRTDEQSRDSCELIIREMVDRFGIVREEALERVNRMWGGLEIIGEEGLVYHEDEVFWAVTIFYGKDSGWWKDPPDLKPLP